MGFSYLDGKCWQEITREERFFCQHLYQLILSDTPAQFVKYIEKQCKINVECDDFFEVGYEVCFYRDLWQARGKAGELFSPKRTFDLCIFGEKSIIIIEAKAAENFDASQNRSFLLDVAQVRTLTNVKNVLLIGLCSSKCNVDKDSENTFTGKILRWKNIASHYENDIILQRADDLYDGKHAFSSTGKNSNIKLSGMEILKTCEELEICWVGRKGGISGELFQADISSGEWKNHIYEVNTVSVLLPSPNYFSFAAFKKAVRFRDE